MFESKKNMITARVIAGVGIGAALVAVCAGWAVLVWSSDAPAGPVGQTRETPVAEGSSERSSSYDYGNDGQETMQTTEPRAKDEIRAVAMQWPQSSADQMAAITGRLSRVVHVVNAAAGSQCIVRLGQTGHVAVANGDGSITLDMAMLWRLSEDALAALIAHEVGHEVLGHTAHVERLASQAGQPSVAQQMRSLELAADQFAGQVVARTGYQPAGFAELLRHARTTDWESVAVRQYYPHARRQAVFQQAFDGERAVMEARVPASRPAAGIAGLSVDGNE